MLNDYTITAVIPVRAGSKRLPNKNILPFGNSNLLINKIRQLKNIKEIDNVVVSSDSDVMLDMAVKEGVNIHKRAIEYCDESTKTFNEVVEHIASSLDGDILIWAPCVCPLIETESIKNAIKTFNDFVISDKTFDSVISAKLFKEYLFDENGPVNFSPEHHVPSQKLPKWKVVINGFFIAMREDMKKWKFVYGKNPYLYVVNKKEAVDIDDAEDFEIAKMLLGRK